MSELEALKYLDWTLYFVMLILVIMVFVRIAEAHVAYKQSLLAIESKADKPDLMEQAMHNISMRHMQKELREILAFSEPNHMRDLVVEYMRLKEAEQTKETNAANS